MSKKRSQLVKLALIYINVSKYLRYNIYYAPKVKLFTYFVILIGFLQIYNNKRKDAISLTDAMGLMLPYSIAFSILWLLIIIGFYIIGLPLGFDASVML